MPVGELRPWDENPRTISHERFENLGRAIAADPDFCAAAFTEVDVRKEVAVLRGGDLLQFDAAVPTGFEPAISSLTGTYARPLHHGTMRCESV